MMTYFHHVIFDPLSAYEQTLITLTLCPLFGAVYVGLALYWGRKKG